jgi:hypothetical protein
MKLLVINFIQILLQLLFQTHHEVSLPPISSSSVKDEKGQVEGYDLLSISIKLII